MTTIRPMTKEDYDQVYVLWSAVPNMGLRALDDSYEGIARFLARNPSTSFVAEQEERIVGALLCGHDGRRAFLYHAAVSPACRRQGIGQELLNAALAALRAEQINRVSLFVYAQNEEGNRFWESMGFVRRDDLVVRNISLNRDND